MVSNAGSTPNSVPDTGPTIKPPVFPSTTSEFITVIAHYHRAEIARMAGWRDRIDRTTNWAITVVAAMLSISLSTPTAHHGVLLFAMLLICCCWSSKPAAIGSSTSTVAGSAGSNATTSPRSLRRSRRRLTIGCRCSAAILGGPCSVSPAVKPSPAACVAITAGCS